MELVKHPCPRGNSNTRLRPCGHITAVGSSETLPSPIYTSYSM